VPLMPLGGEQLLADLPVKNNHFTVLWYRGGLVFETLVSLSLRLKDLLGPVTRVKKKKNLSSSVRSASFKSSLTAFWNSSMRSSVRRRSFSASCTFTT